METACGVHRRLHNCAQLTAGGQSHDGFVRMGEAINELKSALGPIAAALHGRARRPEDILPVFI